MGQGEDLLVAPDTHRSYSDRVNGFSMTSSTALMEAEAEEVFPWRGVLDEEDEGGFEPVYPRDTSGPAMVDRGIAELQLPTVKAVGDRVEGVQVIKAFTCVFLLCFLFCFVLFVPKAFCLLQVLQW